MKLRLWILSGSIFLGVFSGCGQGKSVIENIDVQAQILDQSLWVEMDAKLAKTDFSLPSLVLPLIDPNQPSRQLGQIETNSEHVIIRVNVSEATRMPIADGNLLPNGTHLPISLNGAKVVGIPVANSESMVYVAIQDQQVMVGAAIGIRDIAPSSTALNIFLPVQINDLVSGMGGMYFGQKSGVGVFAMKSGVPQLQSLGIKSVVKRGLFARQKSMELNPGPITKKNVKRLLKKTKHLHGVVSVD